VSGLQVQQEAKAIKVSLDIIVVWVAFLKRQPRGKLGLGRGLETGGDCRDPDL
jgi:hypothetical protein